MASHAAGPARAVPFIFLERTLANEQQLRYYAITICSVMAVFLAMSLTRQLRARAVSLAPLCQHLVNATRRVRWVLRRKVPGFASAGHALLVLAFTATNIALTSTNLTSTSITTYASRFGWMATGNMCLVVFLALKNTPLALWTTYSYERLNGLHQAAGYAMFIHMVLHAATYTAFFAQNGQLQVIYAEKEDILGIVAGFAFTSAVLAAVIVRHVWYELFYSMHVIMWVVGVVAVGIHQPDFGKPILIMTLISASMWLVDRAIRGARILGNSLNNEVILHPLTGGATRVLMKKVPHGAEGGKHFRIWIPSLRPFETHPFTVVNTRPLEFVVRAQDGFTRDLYHYAMSHPGVSVRASADGPYGPHLSPLTFQKVVLIAGGGGATFTVGLALGMLERMDESHETDILFIWVVRHDEILSWLSEHLKALKTHAFSTKVKVLLHVTRAEPLDGQGPSDSEKPVLTRENQASRSRLAEKSGDDETDNSRIRVDHSVIAGEDDEKQNSTLTTPELGYTVTYERPDMASLIESEFDATAKNHRMLVAACGPSRLLRVVRDSTAKLLLRGDSPGVELHCEEFGW